MSPMDYLGIGRWPDTRWTVGCDRCHTEFHGRTEGDTGASYLEAGHDEENGPYPVTCVLCGRKVDICRECRESMAGALCTDCDGDEYETADVAKILGVSTRTAQHIGRQMGKTVPPRMTGFLWTPEEIRTAAARNRTPGARRKS